MLRALLGLAQNGTFNNPTFTGVAALAAGTAAAPSLAFTGSSTTGLYLRGAGQIGMSFGGVLGAFFDSGGGGRVVAYNFVADPSNSDTTLARGAAGVWKFASAGSFTANGVVATSMTSLGPTGSHTTIQEWLTIQNASGVTRYIPCY